MAVQIASFAILMPFWLLDFRLVFLSVLDIILGAFLEQKSMKKATFFRSGIHHRWNTIADWIFIDLEVDFERSKPQSVL